MGYSIDLDLLDRRITQMQRFETLVEQRLADLEKTVAGLDDAWTGLAAVAFRDSHRRWLAGARQMHQALAGLRTAAQVAHKNYSGAVAANVAMWAATQ